MSDVKYKRILLKLSGEALLGDRAYGVDPAVVTRIASEIKEVRDLGVEIALVIGGGNIFRGLAASARGMDRVTGDYMGMLATIMNSLAMQDALEKLDVQTRVLSAIEMKELAEPYIKRRAVRHLERGRIVIFAAGTGNPFFTTDTAASLRAMEVSADVIMKGTKVDGVYDRDPMKDDNAVKYESLTFLDVLKDGLKVMDSTAISLCMDNNLPIIVFNIKDYGNVIKVVNGDPVGTLIVAEEGSGNE